MKKTVVQEHHISYKPDIHGTVYRKEHNVLDGRTGMNRWKGVSKFFITALKVFIALNEHDAVDLDKKIEMRCPVCDDDWLHEHEAVDLEASRC